MVINFEEGAEMSAGDGDPSTEKLGEIVSIIPNGKWDQGTEQVFAYGMRAGIWRMLDWLKRHDRQITFYMCGRAIERAPQIARAIVEAGHEPASHGWLWRPQSDYDSEAAERADFERCIAATLAATGERPQGFFSRGSESPWTRKILRDLGFAYASNGFDDDFPYWDRTDPARPLLVVPYALDSNDMKFFHPNAFVNADDLVTYVRHALEVLVAEGEAGDPRLLNIGWHLRIAGGGPAASPPSSAFSSFWTATATRCGWHDVSTLPVAGRSNFRRSWHAACVSPEPRDDGRAISTQG